MSSGRGKIGGEAEKAQAPNFPRTFILFFPRQRNDFSFSVATVDCRVPLDSHGYEYVYESRPNIEKVKINLIFGFPFFDWWKIL
jgi:hypothetical protein